MKKRTRNNVAFFVALVSCAALAYAVFTLYGTWSSSLNERHKTDAVNSTEVPGTTNAAVVIDRSSTIAVSEIQPVATSTFVNADPGTGSALSSAPPAVIVRFARPLDPSSSIRVFDALDRPVHLGVVTFTDDRMGMTIGVLSSASGMLRVEYTACSIDGTACEDGRYAFSVGL